MPTTATWSNSAPLVEWAVARRQAGVVASELGQPGAHRRRSPRRARRGRRYGGRPGEQGRGETRSASVRRRPPRAGPRRRRTRSGQASRSVVAVDPARSRPSSARVVDEQVDRRRRGTASPRSSAATTAGRSSRFVRARIARVPSSSGHEPERAARSAPVRRRRPGRGRRGPARPVAARIDLGEPLAVVLDEPDGALDDRRRAAVVDLEVDPPQPGQRRVQGQDAPHIGQAPAVDRLVVVADEEDPVRRGGQQEGQRAAASGRRPGPRRRGGGRSAARQRSSSAGSSLEHVERPADQVVEVERAARRERRLVARRTPGPAGPAVGVGRDRRAASTPSSSFSRENAVSSGRPRPARQSGHDLGAGRSPGRRGRRTSTPASRRISRPEGVERPDPDRPRPDAERREGRVQPLAELLGRALVEGDGRDRPAGRRRSSTSQAIRATSVVVLPEPAGATHRTGPGGAVAARALVGRQAIEPGRRPSGCGHRPRVCAGGRFTAGHAAIRCPDAPEPRPPHETFTGC